MKRLQTKKADLFSAFSNFFKINFIAFTKPLFFLLVLKYMPGLLFKAFIQIPESSEITGKFTNFEKKFAFNVLSLH